MLDQENIARGHLAYYLKWTREALAEAGQRYAAKGITTVEQAPVEVQQRNRKTAVDSMASAQTLFAGVRLRQRDVRRPEGLAGGCGLS